LRTFQVLLGLTPKKRRGKKTEKAFKKQKKVQKTRLGGKLVALGATPFV